MSSLIARSFNVGASSYDRHASLQKRVAEKLAASLLEHHSKPASVLEIGCGTGFLTKPLKEQLGGVPYLAIDIAPLMIEVIQSKLGYLPNLRFAVMDGEDVVKSMDKTGWTVSSLVFQWFQHFETTLNHIWQQTNVLAFTTILSGSLNEWQQLCHANGFQSGLQTFITQDKLQEICQHLKPKNISIVIDTYTEKFDSCLMFVKMLKYIGAHYAREGYKPIPLWKIAQQKDPFKVTYFIAQCILEK